MRTFAIDIGSGHHSGQFLLRKYFITEYDNFIASLFMQLHQVLTSDKLIRIADIEDLTLSGSLSFQVLRIEVRRHFTLDLYTLDFSQVTLILKVLPVGLV